MSDNARFNICKVPKDTADEIITIRRSNNGNVNVLTNIDCDPLRDIRPIVILEDVTIRWCDLQTFEGIEHKTKQ